MTNPMMLIAITVLAILLVWAATKLPDPGRLIIIAVLAVALLVVILRLLGVA